jgi:hypothetical protein
VERVEPTKAKELNPDEYNQFVLPPGADVFLDGRACSYDAVPEGAVIVSLEVGPDRRTIVRVYFRSR